MEPAMLVGRRSAFKNRKNRRTLGFHKSSCFLCFSVSSVVKSMIPAGNPNGCTALALALFDRWRRLMFRKHVALWFGPLVLLIPPSVSGQGPTATPAADKPTAPALRKLSDADEKRAKELDEQIKSALKAARWNEAIARTEELVALLTQATGPNHFETVNAQRLLKTLRVVVSRPPEDRAAYESADTMSRQAELLEKQGKYAPAQPLLEKSLEIRRRLLTDDHPYTVESYHNLAANLSAQGKHAEARDRWERALNSLDAARLRFATNGMERAELDLSVRPALCALLARLGRPAEAWQRLEEDLGRGLLDELAGRQDRRLPPGDRRRLRELSAELDRLDSAVETTPAGLDPPERAKRFEDLKRQRALASISLGEFQSKLVAEHGALAGQVAQLNDIQAMLPANTALIAWVDVPLIGPNAAHPAGEHWGVVVRSRGAPAWIRIAGTGPNGKWTDDDSDLANRVRKELRNGPGADVGEPRALVEKLRQQRLAPLAKALDGTPDGLPRARRLIVLPSRAMAGVPVELLLLENDEPAVSYAPSATVLKYLREQPHQDDHAGLLALGDPTGTPSLPRTRRQVEAIARLFTIGDRPARVLLAADASEQQLDHLATSGELARFGFIHFATHGAIDEQIPNRSALILTQTGLPDPLDQVAAYKPVYDARLTVREIARKWALKAELVTLSGSNTGLGRYAGGEGFVGFTQALFLAGTRTVCVSLWAVEDRPTALLMTRFYQNLLGKRAELSKPMPKAEAFREAKRWLRSLTVDQVDREWAALDRDSVPPKATASTKPIALRPYDHPYFWAAFVLVGDPD
jgi:CHAT domain-containing protein